MTQPNATRIIIDTHRHIFGPKLRQKFVENIGFDDTKPLPQANAGEMFFWLCARIRKTDELTGILRNWSFGLNSEVA